MHALEPLTGYSDRIIFNTKHQTFNYGSFRKKNKKKGTRDRRWAVVRFKITKNTFYHIHFLSFRRYPLNFVSHKIWFQFVKSHKKRRSWPVYRLHSANIEGDTVLTCGWQNRKRPHADTIIEFWFVILFENDVLFYTRRISSLWDHPNAKIFR